MSWNQAKEKLENIKDLINDNGKHIKEIRKYTKLMKCNFRSIRESLNEIEDNGKGIQTSLKYIENELKNKRVRKEEN